MSKLIAPSLLSGMALLLASCSSTPASPAAPTTFESGSAVSINATPAAPAHATSFTSCPIATPFVMPMLVTVTPSGSTIVVVTSITTRFTDLGGVQAPAVTLPAPVPTIPFGSALEQARNAQSFSLDVCRTSHRGMVTVAVDTRDPSGRHRSNTVTVSVE